MEHEVYPELEEETERACRECGNDLSGRRKGALYCDDACRMRYVRNEKRIENHRNSYSLANPDVSLDELLRHVDPSTWHKPRELVEEAEDQEPGTFTDIWQVHEAEQEIRARYDDLAEPYRKQLRRNPGVKPRALAELEMKRDQEIAQMWRTWEHASQVDLAKHNESKRIVRAHERQMEQAALTSFGNDRYGSRSGRLRQPEFHGRGTRDLFRW